MPYLVWRMTVELAEFHQSRFNSKFGLAAKKNPNTGTYSRYVSVLFRFCDPKTTPKVRLLVRMYVRMTKCDIFRRVLLSEILMKSKLAP